METGAVVDLLEESVETARSLRARNHYAAEGGSKANLAWVKWHLPDGSLEFLAFGAATGQLGAAEDNVIGLARLLRDAQISIAPFVIARAALEASGRAYVLLDPDMDERRRSELAMREAIHERRTLQDLMLARDPRLEDATVRADVLDVRARIRSLKEEARRRGLDIVRPRPSMTDVICAVLDRHGGGLGMNAVVRYSSLVHAVPHVLIVHAWALDESLGTEWGVGHATLSDEETLGLAVNALVGYSAAVSRQIQIYGWPPSAWDRWLAHVRAVLRK